jgi:hypothetical protein
MSALPPKADLVQREHNIRFVPKVDIPGALTAVQKLLRTIAPQQNWPTPLGEMARGDRATNRHGKTEASNADFAMHSRHAEVSSG